MFILFSPSDCIWNLSKFRICIRTSITCLPSPPPLSSGPCFFTQLVLHKHHPAFQHYVKRFVPFHAGRAAHASPCLTTLSNVNSFAFASMCGHRAKAPQWHGRSDVPIAIPSASAVLLLQQLFYFYRSSFTFTAAVLLLQQQFYFYTFTSLPQLCTLSPSQSL
jgi:hypothetical protein